MVDVDQYNDEDWKRMEKELASVGAEILPPAPLFASNVRNVRCQGYILPKVVVPVWKDVVNFEAKSDDIYVDTFYKAGTTWMQQIVYLICNDPDGKCENKENIDDCFPFMEFGRREFDIVVNMKSPRFIKSHLPYELLPQSIKDKKCKIIYIARNPKDVIVSSYFFIKKLKYFQFQGTLEEHAQQLMAGEGIFCPFWAHVLDFWNRRDDENILFVKYEDMQKDLKAVVKEVAAFLNKELTDEQLQSVTKRSTFSSMSKDDSVNRTNWAKLDMVLKDFKFMRKGETGDWKNHLSESLNKAVEQWSDEHTEGTELHLEYEI